MAQASERRAETSEERTGASSSTTLFKGVVGGDGVRVREKFLGILLSTEGVFLENEVTPILHAYTMCGSSTNSAEKKRFLGLGFNFETLTLFSLKNH